MTQNVLARRPGGGTVPEPPALIRTERRERRAAVAAELSRHPDLPAVQPSAAPPAVSPRHLAAVQPGDDPDATIVIGRHRQDGTRTPRGPARPAGRGGFVGRVAAAAVARLRRRGGAR